MGDDVLLQTDPRCRMSLARLGIQPGQRFLATKHADGVITLQPAVVRPESELRQDSDAPR